MTLPVCLREVYSNTVELKNQYNKDDIDDMIKEIVGADCWAVTIDDNIVFNNYDEHELTPRERVNNVVIRDMITKDPHMTIVVNMYRGYNKYFDIYLFDSDNPTRINVTRNGYLFNVKVFEK